MSKNKIGDLVRTLLLGFILLNLTGCGQAEQPSYTVPRHTGTAATGETGESSAEQERDELPVSQETSAGQETEELPISQDFVRGDIKQWNQLLAETISFRMKFDKRY